MKTDARVRYTRMMIQKTFFHLLKEKPISKITVKEICELAEINRTTFYKHYQDPYDLLGQLEEEAISGLLSMIEESQKKGGEQVLLSILRTIYDNHSVFGNLITAGDDQSFTYRLSMRCFEKIKELSPPDTDSKDLGMSSGLYFSYLAGGISGIINYWLQKGLKESPEAIAETITRLNQSIHLSKEKL